jgi:serine/threonine protein kinase
MLQLLPLALTDRGAARTHAREHRAAPEETMTSTPGANRSPLLVAGQELGDRYRVVELLGEGGMGEVYRVFDRVLGREVALKHVGADHDTLRDEVSLAQQVTHDNVCRTYDLERIDGQYFVKMECLSGETLADHLVRRGTLSIARTIEIIRAIADGLAAAHTRGIVHRDLKPGNIMLDGDRVVLVDFGLAQREGASDLAGTPAYMSPEQLYGAAVDARSDLYALGCVAFEMLAGFSPFGASTLEEQAQRRRVTRPPDLRTIRQDVPRSLAAGIHALLADEPSARLQGLTLLAARPRRRKLGVALVAIALAALAAAWWPPAPWHPVITDLPQYEENADDPTLSPDGKSIQFSSDRGHRDVWAVYVASLAGGEPRRVSPAGTFCVGASWTRDGQAILMSCYIGRERRILREPVDGSPGRDLGPGWAVDDCGDALAVVDARPTGAAIVLRDSTGRDVELARLPGISLARCDRRGEHLVYVEGAVGHPGPGGDLTVLDRHGNSHKLVHGVDSATFTPDGNAIVFAMQRGGTTSLFDIPREGGAIRELTPHEPYAASPHVASDGKTVIYDRDRTSIPLFELTPAGAVQKTFRFERLTNVLSAADTLVATRMDGYEPMVVAIALSDFSERTLARGEALAVTDDEVIVRASEDPRVLRAISLAGGQTRSIATLPARVVRAADGPDGVHVELDRDGASEAWLVGPDGGLSPEGVAGLVMPAPSGGWRVVEASSGVEVTLRFAPPGRALSEPAFERAATWGTPAWVDNDELAYCDLAACHRIHVATGRDVEITAFERPGNRPITASRDGKHWYMTSYVGHVTRHLITNFAERPWAP